MRLRRASYPVFVMEKWAGLCDFSVGTVWGGRWVVVGGLVRGGGYLEKRKLSTGRPLIKPPSSFILDG
jgi:hypothetical protein